MNSDFSIEPRDLEKNLPQRHRELIFFRAGDDARIKCSNRIAAKDKVFSKQGLVGFVRSPSPERTIEILSLCSQCLCGENVFFRIFTVKIEKFIS